MSKPIIYCDMDGVLADFKTGAQKTTGMSINKWMNIPSSREKWSHIKKKKELLGNTTLDAWWQTTMVLHIKI